MTTKTTYILTIIILTCGLVSCGQNLPKDEPVKTKPKFSLTISTYNHAEQLFKGTLTSKLDENVLTISRQTMFSDKDTILFSKKVDSISLDRIENIRLDNLKENYFNNCIMTTSGNEYFVSTTNDTITKTIHLHHYYNKQIERLVNELNKQIPDSLKIEYLTSDTKQDCE